MVGIRWRYWKWLELQTVFTYFFVLFVSTISHVRTYPDIWTRTIYTVDWFVDPRMKAFLRDATSRPRLISWSQYLQGTRLAAGRNLDMEKAPWAENSSVRRGKDNPYAAFTRTYSRGGRSMPSSLDVPCYRTGESVSDDSEPSLPPIPLSRRTTIATENASLSSRLPSLPLKTLSTSSTGSKFIEGLSRNLKKSAQPALSRSTTSMSLFPSTVDDHNLPIPLPRRSEWVIADKLT